MSASQLAFTSPTWRALALLDEFNANLLRERNLGVRMLGRVERARRVSASQAGAGIRGSSGTRKLPLSSWVWLIAFFLVTGAAMPAADDDEVKAFIDACVQSGPQLECLREAFILGGDEVLTEGRRITGPEGKYSVYVPGGHWILQKRQGKPSSQLSLIARMPTSFMTFELEPKPNAAPAVYLAAEQRTFVDGVIERNSSEQHRIHRVTPSFLGQLEMTTGGQVHIAKDCLEVLPQVHSCLYSLVARARDGTVVRGTSSIFVAYDDIEIAEKIFASLQLVD